MTPSHRPASKRPRPQEKPAQRAPFMRRLDRVAAEINPLLVIFVLGLGLLDVTCFIGLEMLQSQHAERATVMSAAYRR
jgi:hypothetical protein